MSGPGLGSADFWLVTCTSACGLVLTQLLPCPAGLRHRGFDAHVFEGAEVLRRETSTMVGLGNNAFYVSTA